jgi:hypothetical protein
MCLFNITKTNYKMSTNKDVNKHIHRNKDKRKSKETFVNNIIIKIQ